MKKKKVAFQGLKGSYSDQACMERLPGYKRRPCKTFDEVFRLVKKGEVDLGIIPVENSIAGGVVDCYDLMASQKLKIIGEHYLPVNHCILGVRGSSLDQIKTIYSHPHAIAQCKSIIDQYGWDRNAVYDTAGSAYDLSIKKSPSDAAIASIICADLYDLEVLKKDIQDQQFNTTRFIIISNEAFYEVSIEKSNEASNENVLKNIPNVEDGPCKTSILFKVRDIPSVLYKCLGGFATNNINLTLLTSRPSPDKQWTYHFYLDFQGNIEEKRCKLALEELSFFTTEVTILGCYLESKKV